MRMLVSRDNSVIVPAILLRGIKKVVSINHSQCDKCGPSAHLCQYQTTKCWFQMEAGEEEREYVVNYESM